MCQRQDLQSTPRWSLSHKRETWWNSPKSQSFWEFLRVQFSRKLVGRSEQCTTPVKKASTWSSSNPQDLRRQLVMSLRMAVRHLTIGLRIGHSETVWTTTPPCFENSRIFDRTWKHQCDIQLMYAHIANDSVAQTLWADLFCTVCTFWAFDAKIWAEARKAHVGATHLNHLVQSCRLLCSCTFCQDCANTSLAPLQTQ